MNTPIVARIAAAVLIATCASLYAAEPAAPPAATAAADSANPLKASAATPAAAPYVPSMPDMMNIAVLSRHEKVGLAGKARNWTYAAYEIRELRSAFTRIARTAPAHDGWDTQAMFTAMIMTPLKGVEDAIKASDAKAFDRQYAALTAACNACHTATGRNYIVIQVPRANAYPNQSFAPPAKSRQ
jgi:hypothetical protein